jgi:pimeloyl-ACP methyl ester carboxylesterase
MKYCNSYIGIIGLSLFMMLINGAQAQSGEAVDFQACELYGPPGVAAVSALCGHLEVAEDPNNASGRKISLRIAKVPARGKQPQPDPLFLFAGGPGQAITEAYPLLAGVFQGINENRDIVLIDQRGTGGSNALKCPFDMEDLNQAFDLDQMRRDTQACLENLDGDPRFYTTTIAMQDYDRVRALLGYEHINLWGGSYGTRAAQVYLRQFPQHVRSIILDSVVPPGLALGSEHGRQLDRTLEAVLTRCEQDESCHKAFPQLRTEYTQLIQELEENPKLIQIADTSTGERIEMLADRNSLAATLRFMSYGAPTQSLIPLMVHKASEGDLESLFSTGYTMVSGIVDQISRGMELSVTCAEDEPYLGDFSAEKDTLIGDIMVQAMQTSCSVWPHGDAPADFHQPFPSTVPALLLAGETDPVTPPAYAHSAAQQYEQQRVIEVPGKGHLVSHYGCMPEVLEQFIDELKPAEIDSSCVQRLGPEPFFLSNTGPTP